MLSEEVMPRWLKDPRNPFCKLVSWENEIQEHDGPGGEYHAMAEKNGRTLLAATLVVSHQTICFVFSSNRHLTECFNHSIEVKTKLTRYKHCTRIARTLYLDHQTFPTRSLSSHPC